MQITHLKELLLGASRSLTENKETLDNLNVFPIPDGDTGTNMEKTLLGAVRVLQEIGDRELVTADLERLYEGILMSAQGNSGVILSQWFKGLSISFAKSKEITALSLNDAFLEASEAAYNAVSTPVEGTILTVARQAQEYAEEYLREEMTVVEYLQAALDGARDSLKNTPELLPVLKEAGVVDSGGFGFVCILSGMIAALSGEASLNLSDFASSLPVLDTVQQEEFGYCTELILKLEDDSVEAFSNEALKIFLNSVGNSIIAVQEKDRVKIHVHTLAPERVLEYCHAHGEFLTVKIENMTVQHQETIGKTKQRFAIAAVADGDGVQALFEDMGAQLVIRGGQSDNLATEQLLSAFNRLNAETVILLPNNANLILVSEQAKKLYTACSVTIIPSESIAEGYAALSMVNPDDSTDDIIAAMREAIANTSTAVVAVATHDSTNNGVAIKKGEYIGIVNDAVVVSDTDETEAIMSMLRAVPEIENKESIVAICKDKQAVSTATLLKGDIKALCPYAEIYFVNGGQEVFDYVFAVE